MRYLRPLIMLAKEPLVMLLSTLVILPLITIPSAVLAQGSTRGGQRSATTTKGSIELEIARTIESGSISAPLYAFDNLQYMISGVTTLAIGPSSNTLENQAAAAYFGPSAVSTLGQGIAYMIGNPPASAEYYVADLLRQTPFVPTAYAQGLGFAALNPVLEAWKAVRDVAYVFFVLVFLVIGFLIMFRQKLGGQVVTAVSAIPNLVITLLLITFSYAIAGFMIDIMYLLIYFVIAIFAPRIGDLFGPGGNPISLEQMALGNNIFFNGIQMVFGNQVNADGSTAGGAADAIGRIIISFFPEDGSLGELFGHLFGGGIALIAYLIIAVAVLFAVFKTFFQLLMSYAMFLISVITAPIQLLAASFGGNGGFTQWLRNLAGHLAPFPTVIILLVLAMIFSGIPSGNSGFLPPQIGLFDSTSPGGEVSALIAIGILMLIPEAVKMSKEIVGAKDDFFGKYMADIKSNLAKGWSGGELMPGVGMKLPGVKIGADAAKKTAGFGFDLGKKATIGTVKMGGRAGVGAVVGGGAGALQGYSQEGLPGAIKSGVKGMGIGATYGAAKPYVKGAVENLETYKKMSEGINEFTASLELMRRKSQAGRSDRDDRKRAAAASSRPISKNSKNLDGGTQSKPSDGKTQF